MDPAKKGKTPQGYYWGTSLSHSMVPYALIISPGVAVRLPTGLKATFKVMGMRNVTIKDKPFMKYFLDINIYRNLAGEIPL